MKGELHGFPLANILPAEVVLDEAKRANLKQCLILGYRDDAEEGFYSNCTHIDGTMALWLLQTAIHILMTAHERRSE